jgi:hypothetical protein
LARTLINAGNAIAACAAGVYFLLVWFDHTPAVSRGLLALLGVLVLILNFWRLLSLWPRRDRELEGPLTSMTRDGAVQVSREAVEAGLRAAGEALGDVTRLRVKIVTTARRRHLLRAHYMAPEGASILEVSSRLRRALVDRFHALVPSDNEGKLEVEMIFEGFYGKAKVRAAESAAAAPAPTPEAPPPFTGPRYPIDAEGD